MKKMIDLIRRRYGRHLQKPVMMHLTEESACPTVRIYVNTSVMALWLPPRPIRKLRL